MITDAHQMPSSHRLREPGPSSPLISPTSMAQSISWAGLTLPLMACAAIWGIGDASPVNVAWLSVVHTMIGTATSAWTALRFVLRERAGTTSQMTARRIPGIGMLVLYALLLLQPVLTVTGSMLHGHITTIFGIPLPSVVPVNEMVAIRIDELRGWNALLLLGLILAYLANAFNAARRQRAAAKT